MFFQDTTRRKTLEKWVQTYSREFFHFALFRLRKHEDAEDAVQITFTKAFRSYNSFKIGSSEKAWLYAILTNTIKDQIKVATSRPQGASLDELDLENVLADSHDAPDEALAKKMEYERLASGIASLPDHFAAPLLMREVSDMSYKEIAEQLVVPIGTVMSRLYRARKVLYDLMTGATEITEINHAATAGVKEDGTEGAYEM